MWRVFFRPDEGYEVVLGPHPATGLRRRAWRADRSRARSVRQQDRYQQLRGGVGRRTCSCCAVSYCAGTAISRVGIPLNNTYRFWMPTVTSIPHITVPSTYDKRLRPHISSSFRIPDSGYIPPEEMVTSLSALPKLKSLIISFVISPLLRVRVWEMNQVPPPPTRFVLPALTQLEFDGVREYLEVLVAGIDAALYSMNSR
jgi:hypothetical protein